MAMTRIADSRDFTHRLLLALACLLLLGGALRISGARAETVVKLAGTGSATPLVEALGSAYTRANPQVRIQLMLPPMGSSAGQRAVMAGAIDLAMAGKPLGQAERDKGGRDWLLGRTPFLILTREAGRLDNIDSAALADIYAGKTTTWRDGSPIRLVLRPPSESDTKLLRALSPAMDSAVDLALARSGLPVAANDLDNEALLEKTPGALGTGNYALTMGLGSKLHPVSLNGVAPTLDNLAKGAYPHFKTIYVARGPALSDAAQSFLDFILSAQGRKVLAAQGYLPEIHDK